MTFDNYCEFSEIAEAAKELAKAFFNTGEFPTEDVEKLQSYYDCATTRRDLLIAMNEQVVLEANPFKGSYEMTDPFNLRNGFACIELPEMTEDQVIEPFDSCFVETKEYRAIMDARARAESNPKCLVAVYRLMPARLHAREAFRASAQIMFSMHLAEQELEFADMEGFEAKIAAAKLPANHISWDSTSETISRGFFYDPEDGV